MNAFMVMRTLIFTAAAASVATTSGAAEKPKDFAFGIPLTVEADSAFYRAALPAAFYAGSARADQGDLRVFNGDDAVVPYARLDSPAAARESTSPTYEGTPGGIGYGELLAGANGAGRLAGPCTPTILSTAS